MLDYGKLRSELYSLVSTIQDVDTRRFTLDMLCVAPESFWTRSASRAHHMEDERGDGGNLLHTIRVTRLASMLCEVADYGQPSIDIVTSAAVLHDICRYGRDGLAKRSVSDHPYLVRRLAEQHGISCEHSAVILNLVEAHMGKWGIKPYIPRLWKVDVVHIADVVIARFAEVIKHA